MQRNGILASKNIMHGDLAAHNILISRLYNDESYLAKISDFGLSKAFYENNSYLKQERKNIPWKWTAVDYFETDLLTLSSDVWSFGVVFWEILSMGKLPYEGGEPDDTIKKIKAGFRLPVPDEVKEANWLSKCYNEVTKMCWQLDPKKRCSFLDLVKIFETLLTTEEKENYGQLEQNIMENKAKM
jgi:cadherin 2 type 1 (N-cadherin)